MGHFIAKTSIGTLALAWCIGAAPAPDAPSSFGNAPVSAHWSVSGGHLQDMTVRDGLNHRVMKVSAPFALHLSDGSVLTPATLTMRAPPVRSTIAPEPDASRLADRKPRTQVAATFIDKAGRIEVKWRLIQVADARYLREVVTIRALKQDEQIPRVDLFDATAANAEVVGRVKGSPIVSGPDYFQFEHPLSQSQAGIDDGSVKLWIDRALPLEKGKSVTYSAAVGVTAKGQLRRGFQAYLADQRAHPYRPFLHYNSWYDIGFTNPYTADQAVERINSFCRELSEKRGVKIDSFLFDDGWDDRTGSWGFSKDFPDGLIPLRNAAAKCGAAPGIWLSPWGGYDEAKKERVRNGKARGYETIKGGLALSGPNYYKRFHAVTMALVTQQGVNQFKFDGTGNADQVVPGSRFNSDFDAAIQLIEDLRAAKPGLFINLTTGTYPSPAWLRYADTIWRGGADHAFTGVGTPRERWITYRDQQTYENIVIGGPLFPLNSLMLHGIIYAQHAPGLNSDPGNDFANEVHSFFGTGTELQEMYITPSLLTRKNWDMLAQAARWSRSNADVLKDTHWIGGDPGRLQVYGWAAWSREKSIITLRNPDDRSQTYLLHPGSALELPQGAPTGYAAKTVWPDGAAVPEHLDAGQPTLLHLRPFEVLTLELTPIS
ncbi:thermostable cytotonic enterotoxin Ast [Stakelama sediminis]|uniref:Enterotoxin n=1 Tax=Stakelama sediminis TaxID=463200 RepID=A0A840YZY9_9SPHN|nr:enterotoxin [Stakelama sediminis]MBB5719185.1 hypothetical protein [Stakelama sediminis]